MTRLLFVTWDGPQVAYLEGLFLPIFAALRQHGYEFSVLQFTWGDPRLSEKVHAACSEKGIAYRRVDVWRAGAAGALLTALAGGHHVDRAVRDWRIDAVMPRSLLPALATMLSRLGRTRSMIFDSDGLAADERVEFAGLAPSGLAYRLLRRIEARAVRRADAVLVRTEATIPILAERAGLSHTRGKFRVVTNGRDPQPFLAERADEGPAGRPRLCYLGSIGPQYLPERMLGIARDLKQRFPETTLALLTRDIEALKPILDAQGLAGVDWITFRSLDPADVPHALSGCDIGFALRLPSLSMSAVAPVKIGDYLLAGLPIIGTPVVGPVEDAVRAGCIMPADFDLDTISKWVSNVLARRSEWRERCRAAGLNSFSLQRSVKDYCQALQILERRSW